jgi:multiple sugar transport system ATP-binding protein
LSGGQRQRVAIGRAIVREPKVFLFDEPLSNLDAALRVQMRMRSPSCTSELGATMIYVTHDQVEAMTLADKIVRARSRPGSSRSARRSSSTRTRATLFVAGFIGSPKMNILGRWRNCRDRSRRAGYHQPAALVEGDRRPVRDAGHPARASQARPGRLHPDHDAQDRRTSGHPHRQLRDLPAGENFVGLFEGDPNVPEGEAVKIGFTLDQVHLFDQAGLAVY